MAKGSAAIDIVLFLLLGGAALLLLPKLLSGTAGTSASAGWGSQLRTYLAGQSSGYAAGAASGNSTSAIISSSGNAASNILNSFLGDTGNGS